MNSKTSLMAALVGLAMLATPIAAAAKDKNHDFKNNWGQARASRAYAGPVVVNKHEFRNGKHATWMPAPRGLAPVEWRDRYRDHRWGDRDDDDYRGYRTYYPTPAYTAPVYAAPGYPAYGGYSGGNCRAAHSVLYNYRKDRATGHPAAAYDLLRQNQWAFHSGCGGAPAPYAGGGLFNGFGRPAYSNGYNGYGYNNGYGQPYGGGSILTPFVQQFVR